MPPPSKNRVPSKPNGSVCEYVKFFKTGALNLPGKGLKITSFTVSRKNSHVKLEWDSSTVKFQCVRPDPFKYNADSDAKDAMMNFLSLILMTMR